MHNLIFIGNIGVGKTTLICNILNFILDNKPVLDIGPGRTTACDVEIKKTADYDSKNNIHVEGYSLQEFQGLLSMFFYERGKLPSELVIALSNMIKFQEWKKKNESNHTEDLEKFILQSEKISKYASRNTEKIFNSAKINQEILAWLKENFHKINTGNHELFKLPKSIKIHININFIKDGFDWKKINKIIDTKGIDENRKIVRSNYLFKEFYCSSFLHGPERNLIEIIKNSKASICNKYLIILVKYEEPVEVNGADGDYEEGIKIKLEEFRIILNRIIFRHNIYCYDSKYSPEGIIKFINSKLN
jgi:hypothetical protein